MTGFVTHFVKHQQNDDDAAAALLEIVASGELRAGTRFIMGGYRCICFSDKPVGGSFEGLFNMYKTPIYSRFGVAIPKKRLFQAGGRPVIYQPPSEFVDLPEGLRWRHVSYDFPRPNFTWEREWRIREDSLNLRDFKASIVCPVDKREWFEEKFDELEGENDDFYRPGIWSFNQV